MILNLNLAHIRNAIYIAITYLNCVKVTSKLNFKQKAKIFFLNCLFIDNNVAHLSKFTLKFITYKT